ncbi:hypothetical protein VIGAN_01213700 [Vigna angularis var. angularis]|uniref:Uncharacterized protein n=1 Tax=Vigna angularis var. angularis TaxID=157739 RepID=A0A0S3R1W7_PHAAN|nr:hypothetical protein VIGAN_01213700 [Vigna angularis var. angularis]
MTRDAPTCNCWTPFQLHVLSFCWMPPPKVLPILRVKAGPPCACSCYWTVKHLLLITACWMLLGRVEFLSPLKAGCAPL